LRLRLLLRLLLLRLRPDRMVYVVTGSGSVLIAAKLVVLVSAVAGSALGRRLMALVLAAVAMHVR
jgi:hypothetical protein